MAHPINLHLRRRSSRPGWVLLDVVAGLLLMLVSLALLGGVLTRSRITASRLADDRAAARLAETMLLALGAHADAKIDQRVVVTPVESETFGSKQWVSITATIGSRHATVIGLVEEASPAGATTTQTLTEAP